uniref:Reverse transcriptase domain-containing protein n=1 Tax=Tanacetum cinerariifolium TaxID=118510 RepID=A0A6L2KMU2_TANCI|nr:reverse transcriptase domain-containing protein [Tanacetum cinerariifolium]
MAELLPAPTEGYAEAIVVPSILADQFELKHSLINMMTTDQFFRFEKDNPHDHIRWFNKITSTIKYKDVPNSAIKLMLFTFSLAGAARPWLEKEPPRSIHTWEDLAWDRYKDLLRASPYHGFTKLHQLDTFYNALNPADQENATTGGNLLERRTQDVLTIIENKSKVYNSRNKSVVSQVKSCDANSNSSSEIAKLTHAVNQQTRAVTTTMTAILKQFQATPPPAFDTIQGYVLAAAVNYNQGNSVYRPLGLGSLPSNTVANLKGELKAITTRSGLVVDGPTVPTPPSFINPEVDERVLETLTDPNLAEYTIKVPPHPVQKYKPLSQRDYVVHQRDPLHPNIPYPLRMLKQKQQEKYEVQIHKFWQMFKKLHINITLADALILMPKFQQMLKALMSNKEKLQELANTPLNENCSSVILKKLSKKLRDPGKFLISCGFSELKCKALADLEMILRNGDERLTLNMRHDTSSYSNQPQKESINLINVFNNSSEDFIKDLFSTNQPSGNPTFSSHLELTSPEVKDDIFNSKGGNVLPEKLLDLDSTKDLHPLLHFDVESDLKEIEFLLYQDIDSSLKDLIDQSNPVDNFVDSMPEMFTDEHGLDYSSPPIFNEYDDDFLEVESDTENVYDDPFDSKGEKIKESKLFIDELDLLCDFPPF